MPWVYSEKAKEIVAGCHERTATILKRYLDRVYGSAAVTTLVHELLVLRLLNDIDWVAAQTVEYELAKLAKEESEHGT